MQKNEKFCSEICENLRIIERQPSGKSNSTLSKANSARVRRFETFDIHAGKNIIGDSPLSCRRVCRGSWYRVEAERRRRAIHRCISANGPTARSEVRVLCFYSCACPADAWLWIFSQARPDRPPDRSAPPNATATWSAVADSSARSLARWTSARGCRTWSSSIGLDSPRHDHQQANVQQGFRCGARPNRHASLPSSASTPSLRRGRMSLLSLVQPRRRINRWFREHTAGDSAAQWKVFEIHRARYAQRGENQGENRLPMLSREIPSWSCTVHVSRNTAERECRLPISLLKSHREHCNFTMLAKFTSRSSPLSRARARALMVHAGACSFVVPRLKSGSRQAGRKWPDRWVSLIVGSGHRYLPSGAVRRGSLGQAHITHTHIHTPRLQSERAPFLRHASGATTESHRFVSLFVPLDARSHAIQRKLRTRYTVGHERARPDTEQPIVATTCGIKLVARRLPPSTGWPRSCGETTVRWYTNPHEVARSEFDSGSVYVRRTGASERGYHVARDWFSFGP